MKNHEKTDRLFELAEKWRLPVVYFAESGGGRPGDTDRVAGGGVFNTRAFALQGRLSALVPQVGVANGRCFAGAAVSSEERRVGKEWVSTCRFRVSRYH